MNTKPQLPQEFQQIILEKSQDFFNCEFVFNAIDDFIDNQSRWCVTLKTLIIATLINSHFTSTPQEKNPKESFGYLKLLYQ